MKHEDEEVFEAVMEAVQGIDGDFPLVDVLEALSFVIAVSAKGVEMSPANLVACFAQTVDRVYDDSKEGELVA